MRTSFKNGFYAGLLAAFIFGLWLTRLWGAENQVRLHSEHFLRAVETHRWFSVKDMVATTYRDDWGNDRAQLVLRLRLVSRSLSSLTIIASDPRLDVATPAATWWARLRLEAQGEAAREISAQVNGLTTPFELHWRRESRWPWDWKLVAVKNPDLHIAGGDF